MGWEGQSVHETKACTAEKAQRPPYPHPHIARHAHPWFESQRFDPKAPGPSAGEAETPQTWSPTSKTLSPPKLVDFAGLPRSLEIQSSSKPKIAISKIRTDNSARPRSRPNDHTGENRGGLPPARNNPDAVKKLHANSLSTAFENQYFALLDHMHCILT